MKRETKVDPKPCEIRVNPLIVGIAGGSGSGKTTFVARLGEMLESTDVICLQHDYYYRDLMHLPEEARANTNFDHPSALESDLLVSHLQELRENRSVEVPSYDFATHTRLREARIVRPAPLIIVEGVLLFTSDTLLKLFDLTIFIEADADIRLARRIRRDLLERGRTIEGIMDQYFSSVRPMHEQFVEPSKVAADLCISWNEPDVEKVSEVANRIQRSLGGRVQM